MGDTFTLMLLRAMKRQALAIVVDACIIINSYVLASLVLFARRAPLTYYDKLLIFLPFAILVHCGINHAFGLYRSVGRYVGIHQALKGLKATALATSILVVVGIGAMPEAKLHVLTMVPIGGAIVFLLSMIVRFYPRVFYERSLREVKAKKNLLIVGAGAAGGMIIRNIQNEVQLNMKIVALVDDNPELQGLEIHGLRIYGPSEIVPELVQRLDVDKILIAVPSASLHEFQRLWRICSGTEKPVNTLGSLQDVHFGKVGIEQIREIQVEDILGRQAVKTDYTQIKSFVRGKTVLVSGAGGSIGSELVRQISYHSPKRIVLVDKDESALYHAHEQLKHRLFYNHDLCVADIKSEDKMEAIFTKYRPELVFHAAAYKHVPLMELHPDEAVLNNVLGTLNMAKMAGAYACESFVNISTDKAVEPVNVMGATKLLSEWVAREVGAVYHGTKFCSVRFGNVIGSRGSVIPIFREQIKNGGPVTVTHPEMTRYFMLISEAVDLVLQAATFPGRNVVYVLEMGTPIRVLDVAQQMIDFMRPPKPVEITFVGLRPGEKLHEQLFDKEEKSTTTEHPMIYKAFYSDEARDMLLSNLDRLFASAKTCESEKVKESLQGFIPSYKPFDMSQVGSLACEQQKSRDIKALPSLTRESALGYHWSSSQKN